MASFSTEQLEKLEEAIAQGALRVKYADKEVQYRSLDEMFRIREMMRQSLGLTGDGSAGRVYPTISKDLE
ncbi:MAG: hypothetical protein A2428_03085 [Bdellovibrionales bacterium RIFOXYC1_FULL_54_43]|nr:MAG: hypothetical protein A2428_03085 [Bdellovibrionales bacterium RIFOXYC1_FULL_54_43]OFZ82665.1 MAG: hypothetical protein A2603_02520 [Bdellovibrionales bacterium RIFOXYD1_FULL_55_31]